MHGKARATRGRQWSGLWLPGLADGTGAEARALPQIGPQLGSVGNLWMVANSRNPTTERRNQGIETKTFFAKFALGNHMSFPWVSEVTTIRSRFTFLLIGLDWWFGFGFEPLLVKGKLGKRRKTTKPPIQTTNKEKLIAVCVCLP